MRKFSSLACNVCTDVCTSSCLAHGVCEQLACLQAGRLLASSSHALAVHLCGQFAWLTCRRCACRWWARATLRRDALAACREDEESSWCLPCERSACVRWVMRLTRFVSVRKKEDEVVCAQRGHDGVYFLNVTNHACDVSGRLP